MNQSELIKEISTFVPIADDWRPLDKLLQLLWESGPAEDCILLLFGVFERFPEEDGAGVLWSIVHGIENSDIDYRKLLLESISRKSSFMAKIMLDRLERERSD
jgi:hypothetical protein